MTKYYTDEKNAQIIVALLKQHGINKVIASPGSANSPLVASFQADSFFQMYSCVDERSAAYMACGLAAETGKPVVISCTGATASRNYLPGLTEAFYRKLPILAITSTRAVSKIGHLEDQVMDRTMIQKDVAKISVTLPIIESDDDIWECEIKINQAILELRRHGGGPAHINLPTNYIGTYSTKELPKINIINRITAIDEFPDIPKGKVAVFVGSHHSFTKEETNAIDRFCATNNAVVLCDHTSGYKGKYKVLFSIALFQSQLDKSLLMPDTLIHIGEISGFYGFFVGMPKQVWRVSEDGEVRDTLHKLRYVFEMQEQDFFDRYTASNDKSLDNYLQQWLSTINKLNCKIPELPFSNVWIASKMANRLPEGATIHFGILNSLRSWNFFELPHSVISASNVGGFGIDGSLSSLLGASFADRNKLYFGILGDLSFFYDMNAIGNRHCGNNLRILLVNNGKGTEFKLYMHKTADFGEDTDEYVAGARHFGNKSLELVKHYATDLGFEYLSASNKEEFEQVYDGFIAPQITNKSKLLEVFTTDQDENMAQVLMKQIETNIKGGTKMLAKEILGEKGIRILKNIIK